MSEPLVGAVTLPDGVQVRGRGRSEPLPDGPVPDLGLALGTERDHGWVPGWPVTWVAWPDFRKPSDDVAAAEALIAAHGAAARGERLEITCGAGTGRTGTALACLAVLAGHPTEDAVSWVREHHRPRAVETPGQRFYVLWFSEYLLRR